MSRSATARSPPCRRTFCRPAPRRSIDARGRIVLPGMIDTHAHVYRYVSGRFGMDADMVGVHSGVTTLIDQGGPSCMTLPGFRHFVAEPAKSRVYAFLSSYLVGGLEGHLYPNLYSPDCINIQATVDAAKANLDIVRGIKGHAEIGGFARWGIKVLQMSAEIGRKTNLPLYVHFGQLWGLPRSGANGEDADTILERVIPGAAAGRHPGASVHAPSRRLRQPRGTGARGHPGRARPRPQGRRRPRQPLLLSPGPQGARCRHRAGHAGRRHARLQHLCSAAARHARRARRRRGASVRRAGEVQPDAGDELDAGARPDASSRSCRW